MHPERVSRTLAAALLCLLVTLVAPPAMARAPVVFTGRDTCRDMALTYDTEFGPSTVVLAATLEELYVRATWFFVGRDVAANGDLVRRIATRHQIGNHSYSHPFLTQMSPAAQREELQAGEAAIMAVTGRSTKPLFRPPYGEYDGELLEIAGEEGYGYVVMWSITTDDWQNPPAETIRRRIVDNAHRGAIVLMHGSPAATAEGTRLAVGDLRERGYQFVTLTEILGNDRTARDFGGDTYRVQFGDAADVVAFCHNVSMPLLLAYNELETLPAGILLRIPHRNEVLIRVGGVRQEFAVYPRLLDDRTLAHVRLAERLGAEVAWDGERVIITQGTKRITIRPGDRVGYVNGVPVDMGAAAFKENDRVMAPVRFVAEQLGASVEWDGAVFTVRIMPR